MNEPAGAITGPASVLVAVPLGRNVWIRKEATLHYAGSRLIKAEGIELPGAGPLGLTGTLYLVKASLHRENRSIMRLERQKIVNGQVVQMQNWGEIEDAGLSAA